MARTKGTGGALRPLMERDPRRHALVCRSIKDLGITRVAQKANVSRELVRLFISGKRGISEQSERNILRGIKEVKDNRKLTEKMLRDEALEALTN